MKPEWRDLLLIALVAMLVGAVAVLVVTTFVDGSGPHEWDSPAEHRRKMGR